MDSYHTSSGKATTMRQSAGLSGEPIGEPRICWENSSANGKLGHFQGHADDGFDVPSEDLAGDVQSVASSALDDVAHLVAAGGFD